MSNSYKAKKGSAKSSRQLVIAVLAALALFDGGFWLLAVEPAATRTADREAAVSAIESLVQQKRDSVAKLRESTERVAGAREKGEELLGELTFDRDRTFSELLTELGNAATAAGVEMRETDYASEEIAGNEKYGMVSVTANFRGRYENLVKLLNRLDRSSDFLIVESLGARPREDTGDLQITMRIDTFVRDL
jgi:Tfp pilus assembly protein PilO